MEPIREVTVEFFGVPRQKAGRAELVVQACTVAEAIAAIEKHCPRLKGLTGNDGQMSPQYLLSVDGENFLADVGLKLQPGSRLLLLSADAGG